MTPTPPGDPPMTTPPEPSREVQEFWDTACLEKSPNGQRMCILPKAQAHQHEWEQPTCPYGFGRHERHSVAACDVCKKDVVIESLRDRLALAEANNERLASDVSRMSVDAAHREQEAVAAFHEQKRLQRQLAQLDQANVTLSGQNTDLSERLALAEQALVDAGLREDRLRAALSSIAGLEAECAANPGWSGLIVAVRRATGALSARLDETTPTQPTAVTQAVHSAAEPRFTVNPLRCAEISPRRLSHP